MKPKILIVDDNSAHRMMLEAALSEENFEIFQAENGQMAIDEVETRFFDLVLMDIRMNSMGGIEALQKIRQMSPGIPIIMMTAYASVNTAVEALKSGAFDYLTKPIDIDELKILVGKALRHHQLETENAYMKERLQDQYDFSKIIGSSEPMLQLFETISMVAPTEATVLITGESGTGKELIANAIHNNSTRKERPFIKVNCTALPENLLESELFGHEKGAFTGAVNKKPGRFRAAHEGTLFLDEISEMPLSMQPKLLRVLQEGEIDPVGSSRTLKVDVRVIAATNKDPHEAVANGKFREDLYYRLNVVHLHVPPLRERRDDIPLLADFFITKHADKNKKYIKGLVPKSLDIMMRYSWPGNVRELGNLMERAVIMARGDSITPDDFPERLTNSHKETKAATIETLAGMPLKAVEKKLVIKTLEGTGGNRTRTAEILGISRRTLQLKLKEYGIN